MLLQIVPFWYSCSRTINTFRTMNIKYFYVILRNFVFLQIVPFWYFCMRTVNTFRPMNIVYLCMILKSFVFLQIVFFGIFVRVQSILSGQ